MDARGDQQQAQDKWEPDGVAGMVGCFWARVWDLDCLLTLRLDAVGALSGSLEVDGEPLDVVFWPAPPGELCGVVRAQGLDELFATFRAWWTAGGALEAEVAAAGGVTEAPQRVRFTRLDLAWP